MRSRATPVLRCPNGEKGAVAILTAMLAIVLFGFGALAVELGDLYSRDGAVQTTADLAAYAGAQDLPNACNAFNSALSYLNSDKNGVFSDTEPSDFAATAARMSDGQDANGEIEILDWKNDPHPVYDSPVTPCSDAGHRVKVTTPTRTVKFPLASTLPGAPTSSTVQGRAAVELRSLDHLSVLPFSIPASCPAGAQVIYTRNGIPAPPSGSPDYQPPGDLTGPFVDAIFPTSAPMPVPLTIEVSLSRLRADPGPPDNNEVQFDFHLLRADGTTLRSPPGEVDGTLVGASVPTGPPPWFNATFTVPLPPTVQTTPGVWHVRAIQPGPDGTDTYTRDGQVQTFTVESPVPTSCIPTAGISGLLGSPRSDGGSAATQRAKNFILGIDHDLFPVANPTTDQPCDADGAPYVDARLDTTSPTDGATCVDVLPIAFAASPTAGLINGVGSLQGRLEGLPTVSTNGNCRVASDPDLQWTKNLHSIVDTALSCYLDPTKDLADVANGVEDSLTPAILSDPRFFVIPTTDTTFHPSNTSEPDQFWPIKSFLGAFLTNETVAGGDASCDSDEGNDCNGLVFNGSQLASVQVFTFPLSALQDTPDHPGNGRAYIGGPKDLLLVE